MTNKIMFSTDYVGIVTVGIYKTDSDPDFSNFQTSSDITVGTINADEINVSGNLNVDGSPVTGQVEVREGGSIVSAAVSVFDFYPGISVSVNSGIASIVSGGTPTTPLAGANGGNFEVQYNNNGAGTSEPHTDKIQISGWSANANEHTGRMMCEQIYSNNSNPLIIANSDQFIEWDSSKILYAFSNSKSDGGILTFPSSHPKWSYAKLDDNGFVIEVAEKKPISNNATVGIYWWKKGSEYVKYAEQMIKKNIRTNNEFYVCPVFNEAIKDNKKITIKKIEKDGMWGIGTPEDLNNFLKNYSGDV